MSDTQPTAERNMSNWRVFSLEKKENQRIMLTKQLLQTAFLKLLQLKPIHAISIRELCTEAGINRTTFYYHYGSQYDLLADISGRFLDSIARCLKDADGNSQEGIQQRCTAIQVSMGIPGSLDAPGGKNHCRQGGVASGYQTVYRVHFGFVHIPNSIFHYIHIQL